MKGARILIVDDEAFVTRVLKLTLEREGYAVEVANNGQQALDMIASREPEVIITDIQMPKMGGRELCEKVRSQPCFDSILLMVMSSMAELSERQWVAGLGNIEFLEKPLSARQMILRLAQHFNRKAAVTESPHA